MFFKSLWPAFLWGLFILVICGIPGNRIPRMSFLDWLSPDKIVHLFVFGLLSFLLIRGFMKQDAVLSLKVHPKTWSVLITIAYGSLIEILQEYVFIKRTGDVRDVLADAIGAFIGLWFLNRLIKKRFSRDSSSS